MAEKLSKEDLKALKEAGRIPLKKATLEYKYDRNKRKGKHVAKDFLEHTFELNTTLEGFEHPYFWILDFLRGSKYTVEKTADYFAASEMGNFFQTAGTSRSAIEKRASELLQTVGILIKSVITLIWDLKEFDQRLKYYNDYKGKDATKKSEADLALKAIYLTEVDIKKGRGSVNMLTSDANFVTLRDAFMAAESTKDLEKDGKLSYLNQRVKNVLIPRISEYQDWVKLSGTELSNRRKVEKAYLNSQVNALKMYTKWARPYLVATNRLMPPEGYEKDPDLVAGFNVAKLAVSLRAKKEETSDLIKLEKNKVWRVIEADFNYRSFPEKTKTGPAFRIRLEVKLTPYVFTKEELDKIEQKEELEVWQYANYTEEALKILNDDLKNYMSEEEKEEGKKINLAEEMKKIKIPIVSDIFESLKEMGKVPSNVMTVFGFEPKKKGAESEPKLEKFNVKKIIEKAKEGVKADAWKVFEIYKKEHKMMSW